MLVAIKQLTKFTIFGYLNSHTSLKKSVLIDVKKYWNNLRLENKDDVNQEKVVLVECMQKANPNWDSYYKLVGLLSIKSKIKVVALTDYRSNKSAADFLSNYHPVDCIESIYKPLDIFLKIKSLLCLVKNYPYVYSKNNGISVFVKGADIGDLIYDEYLRVAKKETLRNSDLLFYFMAYKSIYAHYRYFDIIEEHGVTDMVSIRDTYSHSSYYRASKEREITIWKNRAGPMSSIRKLKTNHTYNHKPFYFEIKHLEYLKAKYSYDAANDKYDEIINKRKSGNVETGDSREIKLAHNNNEILSVSMFDSTYSYDKSKKNIIIYAHIFVDAVRYPHSVIFSDHYTWLIETLLFLTKDNKYNVMVKPHPSECLYDLGKDIQSVVSDINSKLNSNIIILDKKIEFSVIKEVAEVLITGSGTIAMEGPCEGVKVITCGSSSYENTGAMYRSNSQKEYFSFLDSIEELTPLSKSDIYNSKLGFIWLNDEMYVKSRSCIGFEKDLCAMDDFIKLNTHYKSLKNEDIKLLLERMNDDRIN